MEYIFWICAGLVLFFVLMTIRSKKKSNKLRLRWMIPTFVFAVPFVLLLSINIIYNTQIRPTPSTSSLVLENAEFSIGVGARVQPTTLEEYVEIVAPQIGRFHEQADSFWPSSSFSDSVAYFITNDKKEAWKVEHDGRFHKLDDVKTTPRYNQVLGYSVEFLPLDPKQDGEKGIVMVISEDELLDQKSYERYTHVGMYDPIITYIHEGFHIFTQNSDDWNFDPSGTERLTGLDNFEARKMRTYTLHLLYQAIQDEQNRDLYVRQAVKLHRLYEETYSEEFAKTKYLDQIEGTAFYFEVVSCLQVCYPDTIHSANYLKAATLWTTNREASKVGGASEEAYELGAASGILLDMYATENTEWKKTLSSTPDLTPIKMLESFYSEAEISQTPSPEIEQSFIDSLRTQIDANTNTRNNLISFLYYTFF